MVEKNDKKSESGWTEVSIDFYKFVDVNDEISGELVEKDIIPFKRGDNETEVGKYTLRRGDDSKVAFLGGIQLDELMKDIDIGDTIKVVFVGKLPTSSGNQVKQFKLYKKS